MMKLTVHAIGKKMPDWVEIAASTYLKRFTQNLSVAVQAVDLKTAQTKSRSSQSGEKQLATETLLAQAGANTHTVALDVRGKAHTTESLAKRLSAWMQMGKPISLLIGGAEGLADDIGTQVDETISLSPMTFPHPLVRVIAIEQLYRAWTLMNNHPYHRG